QHRRHAASERLSGDLVWRLAWSLGRRRARHRSGELQWLCEARHHRPPDERQARLTMTFKRPDMGHIQFTWVLDDPKTYTRAISNDRVFVLTPNVEVMEYSCMEGNIQAILEGVLAPWTGPKDSDKNLVYDASHDWAAYDLAKSQKLTGVIRETNYTGP